MALSREGQEYKQQTEVRGLAREHVCSAQDRLGKLEDISSNLKAKIECLTIENAGLRAHNQVLLDAVSASTDPNQAST